MGERKVLNKYIPPDFDPSKIPRSKKKDGAKAQSKSRMMLPCSIQCDTCGNFITKGTKFNSRKEDAIGEEYLGLKVFRFYFRCSRCGAELVMKTDPKNGDYVMESGARRNYEPWKERKEVDSENLEEREREEAGDTMKQLENRTNASKREMDITAALDEMRSLKARHAGVTSADAINAVHAERDREAMALELAEEAEARAAFENSGNAGGAGFVRRLESSDDDDEVKDESKDESNELKRRKLASQNAPSAATKALVSTSGAAVAKPVVTRPKPKLVVVKKKIEAAKSDSDSAGGLGLLGGYGSDS
jgi:hypothetical protein|tara:strand:+ start:2652 stop:3566 length:915 start_codon:yes stop_codon:yes gene_type:complete